jgi:hypothetical protein
MDSSYDSVLLLGSVASGRPQLAEKPLCKPLVLSNFPNNSMVATFPRASKMKQR